MTTYVILNTGLQLRTTLNEHGFQESNQYNLRKNKKRLDI